MTKSSAARVARRLEEIASGDPLTFGDIMPENTIFPEDIPLLFRKTAEDIAGCYFEEEVGPGMFNEDNTRRRSKAFRLHWQKNCQTYIKLNWPMFLETAKIILAGMLQNPGISLAQKDEISTAFIAQAADGRMVDFSEHLAPGAVH